MENCQIGDEPDFIATIYNDTGGIENISTATNLKIVFRKPTAPTDEIEVTAIFSTDGTDGKMKYSINGQTTVLLDDNGIWHWQPKLTLASGADFRCLPQRFKVNGNLN